jgi:acyl-homoserine-lactone acylase
VLRAVRWHDDPDGRAVGDFGDGFMMVMDWAPDRTLTTRVISQWGASDRPESPHYNDQSAMFARREWRTVQVVASDQGTPPQTPR